MNSISIDVPPLDLRAAVGDVNEDTRTIDLIFSTGADVTRYDWMSGGRYIERLSMKPEHVRLERLNAGAPLLNSHSAYDLSDQLGVVEEGSASVDGKVGRAAVRFPKAEDDPVADQVYRKVRDKIIRNVSVGYRVHRFEETKGKDNALPVRLATDWEPFEISLVAMPADTGARVRAAAKFLPNPCELIPRVAMNDDDLLCRLRLAQLATPPALSRKEERR